MSGIEPYDSAVLFAADVLSDIWDNGPADMDGQSILDAAERQDLIHWRKPTQAELDDHDWWGHEFEICADDQSVGEFTQPFRDAIRAAEALRKKTA